MSAIDRFKRFVKNHPELVLDPHSRAPIMPQKTTRRRKAQPTHIGRSRAVTLSRARGRVKSGSRPTTVHSRTERFATVTGTGALTSESYNINPAQSQVFPWFHEIAALYDRYIIRNLVIRYVPATGTDVAGSVLIAFDPEALDTPPASMEDAQQMSTEAHGPAWATFEMRVPTDRVIRYTRPQGGITPTSADLKSYDAGIIHVLTDGTAAAAVGYLEVDYLIELIDPQPSRTAATWLPGTAAYEFTGAFDIEAALTGDFLRADQFTAVHNSINVTNAGTYFDIPAGVFDVTAQVSVDQVTAAAGNGNVFSLSYTKGADGSFDPAVDVIIIRRSYYDNYAGSATSKVTGVGTARVVGPIQLHIGLAKTVVGTGDTSCDVGAPSFVRITQLGYA